MTSKAGKLLHIIISEAYLNLIIREYIVSDLYQQNKESTLTIDQTDTYWDSGNKHKGIAASLILQKNHSLPVVHKKELIDIRRQLQIELIRGAQKGNRKCLEQLARQAKGCLEVYVYRLTQQHDLSQEIVQESLLEMFKVIDKLKKPHYFWPWLYGIATNKLRRHYRNEQKQRKIALSSLTRKLPTMQTQSSFENMVCEELKQIIYSAMNKLKIQHKAVLIMRCYNDMAYSEIAESLGCSEVRIRMLFMRGKRALQKELFRDGFGGRLE
jgi:RNA polymerase sigma-70 factor (ECF subfamily)